MDRRPGFTTLISASVSASRSAVRPAIRQWGPVARREFAGSAVAEVLVVASVTGLERSAIFSSLPTRAFIPQTLLERVSPTQACGNDATTPRVLRRLSSLLVGFADQVHTRTVRVQPECAREHRVVSDVRSSEESMLIGQLVVMTGRTEAEVVIAALRREVASARAAMRRPTAEQILDGAKRVRRHLKLPLIDHGKLLYDEHGLPR